MHTTNETQTPTPSRRFIQDATGLSGAFIAERSSRQWRQAAALGEDQYALWFNASLHPDYPWFLGIKNAQGLPSAVIGARLAARQPTFCERYLDQDVAEMIAAAAGSPVARNTVVELGNLAVSSRKQLIPLMLHVRRWAIAEGCDWIVFSLTRELRASFDRMGIEMLALAPARADRVGSKHKQWGSYYHHDPFVLAARVCQRPDFI